MSLLLKATLPKVPCERCDGTGIVNITSALYDTYNIVKRLKTATSFDVLKHPDFRDRMVPSGMSNRLEKLHRLGLLSRIRNGRAWIYSVKK